MRYKNTIISLGFIAAMGFAAWTALLSYYRPQTITPTQSRHIPDAFMEDVVAVIMGKQGKPKMKIVTPKMVHYSENDTTQLLAPQLTLYRKSPQPWYITSKYAKSTQGIDTVDFWEDVVIHHSADTDNPATLIKTPTLTVHPNEQTADTKDHITMIQPNTIVKAVGMHADMNTGNINLLSQARGEYVPTS
ncbi:LPS export ABC transporter periplasmic protein LptC [Aquicella lusitana]|uniref:Lipopolysaccharide export system protein LptC n=1 Tax=Aquicella lusitana TaxID=254246 RepID=A0A370GYR8_9COXI|nr:LPS export ABC transporter periplasmic protein LptC [Aquicella lusitana]RDI48782.1 lipopolysaccharide export system protein LptC [Aquicella lusitana]VVC73210.1 Lipopolysaccharide export system protein LptC [Aquicella lusitana]